MPTPSDKKKAAGRQGEQLEEVQGKSELSASKKFIAEQLANLTAMIGGVKDDIGKAETRTVQKIDSKVDDLAHKLGTRMSKAEGDLARLSTEVATTRTQLQSLQLAADEREKALPALVEKLVRSSRPEPSTTVGLRESRRHHPLPDEQLQAPGTRVAHEEGYWIARRSLRLWPVEGEQLEEAVLSFLPNKLMCPVARVSKEDFVAKRVYSAPDLVVTFSTVTLRDKVSSMYKNLRGADRKAGVQLEAPDHLRGHY